MILEFRYTRCGRILSGICEPYCLITPDLTMRYCPILILIDYKRSSENFQTTFNLFLNMPQRLNVFSWRFSFRRWQGAWLRIRPSVLFSSRRSFSFFSRE
ncbi:hypothetical protein NEIMUCOT_05406 [Neisseria mucosa ATCC 25996]|uniref:Uncharacterized protein n=1 Tax=Neisseria mucosa (strain ATCC 25996 / DSM 4631 / NCTC 10774 / M26) TaxID=546266 RepID=D2ZXQ2_NEIM2|nr:hypothetical protein NEIMUCOT_05406 [Neisseria mucosa ATCC 25996]